MGIVSAGGTVARYDWQEMKGEPVSGHPRNLSSSSKDAAFFVAHDNSINQMIKVGDFSRVLQHIN